MKNVDWAKVRKWGYAVAAAVLPLLVAYGIVTADKAPLWLSLVGAALVPAVAAANTHSDALATQVADKVAQVAPSAAEVAHEVAQVAPTARVPSAAEVADAVVQAQGTTPAPVSPSVPSQVDVLDPGTVVEGPSSVAA